MLHVFFKIRELKNFEFYECFSKYFFKLKKKYISSNFETVLETPLFPQNPLGLIF